MLSQWRAYGNGVGGYALGFDGKYVGYEVPKDPVKLIKIMYARSEQESVLDRLLDQSLGALCDTAQAGDPRDVDHLVGRCCQFIREVVLSDLVLRFKSQGFQEEKEWRVVVVQNGLNPMSHPAPLGFHVRGDQIIPHLSLDLSGTVGVFTGRLPICTVTYGPTPHPDLTARSLTLLLGQRGFTWPMTEINESAIPYRA